MKETVMQGKPYAGNPHVRFDEGAGASRHSGRSALLYNMNKLITFAAVAASAAIPMSANAATPITNTINGVEWRFMLDTPTGSEGTAMLGINPDTSGKANRGNDDMHGCSKNVSVNAANIPWEFDYDGVHYTVTKVADGAFYDNRKLTGIVTIPPDVTEVRDYAFQVCIGLTGLRGGDSVTSWGTSAFNGCTSMTGAYPDLSATKGTMGETPFYNCPLTGTLKLGSLVTAFDRFAFRNCFFSGAAIIPANVTTIGTNEDRGVFETNPNLTAIWVKGKSAVANQTYTTVYCGRLAADNTSLKIVLMGQNTKGAQFSTGNNAMLHGDSGVQVFVPANGYWDDLNGNQGDSSNKVWYYGPTNEFDLVVDDNMMRATFTPTTVNALTNAIAWAPSFKEYFDLDPRISVTNTIDLTDVTITEDMTSGVTFDRLVFSAKTQAQLTNILGAFPATTPISIDPTGLTENMVIPETYNNVFVKTVPGVTIKRTASGFMIMFK